jgi:hypothetical protein
LKKPCAPNPKFASEVAARVCELRNRDTSCLEGSDSVWAAMSYRSKQPSHDLGRSALHAGVHHAHFMDGEGKRLIPCERARLRPSVISSDRGELAERIGMPEILRAATYPGASAMPSRASRLRSTPTCSIRTTARPQRPSMRPLGRAILWHRSHLFCRVLLLN